MDRCDCPTHQNMRNHPDAAPVQPPFAEVVAADVAKRSEGLPVVTEVAAPEVTA